MIYKRYGTSYQSVDPDFEAKALNEIGFRRNRENAIAVDGFDDGWSAVETVELLSEAQGPVQTETEQLLLDRLEEKLRNVLVRVPEGGLLLVENESGHDYPKPRQTMKNVIVEGENRLHFEYAIHPALRVTIYAPAV